MNLAIKSLLAGCALGLLGSAALAEPLSGRGAVLSKDPGAGTIQIESATYHLTSRTVLEDARGARLTLAELPARPAGDPGLFPIHYGRYEAERSSDGLVLRSLRLIEAPE